MSDSGKRQGATSGGADTEGAGTGNMVEGDDAGGATHYELGGSTSGGHDTDGAGSGGMVEGKDAGGPAT